MKLTDTHHVPVYTWPELGPTEPNRRPDAQRHWFRSWQRTNPWEQPLERRPARDQRLSTRAAVASTSFSAG